MKLNIAYPATGCQKLIEVDDEHRLRAFYEKRMSTEMGADHLGDEWKGYVVRITGGNDKQGFPMKQGVLTANRVRLLMSRGHSCYRPRRKGERKRKSVRGCIVDANLSVLNLIIVKKGVNEIPGLTDTTVPRRLGPKRASKIRKLFNLSKDDDVRQYVVRRPLPVKEGKKPQTKAPKIQRLVTPLVLQRKRHRLALRKRRIAKKRDDIADYTKLLAMRMKEAKERKAERRRTASKSRGDSTSSLPGSAVPAPKTAKGKKGAAAEKPTGKAAAKASAKASAKAAAKAGGPKGAPKGAAAKAAAVKAESGKAPKAAAAQADGGKAPKGAAAKGAASKDASAKKPATKAAAKPAAKAAPKPAAKAAAKPAADKTASKKPAAKKSGKK